MTRALTSEQADILADKYIMSLYQDLEDEVIADIARRVKKTGSYTETAELMAKSMREQGYSPEQIRKEVMKHLNADKEYQMFVAENTKAYKEEVQALIKQLVKEAKRAGDELVAEAGEMSWNADLSMWEEHGVDLKKPNSMSQLLNAFKLQTANSLRNLTKTTGFKNVNTGTVGVMSAYQKELDLAVLKVSTGVFSYDQAVIDCVKRLAQSGLRTIDYASGRTYQLDTAARMAVRTGMSQLAGRIMEENLKSTGQDLVITSQHMSARPDHAPWQNKVFSYSGKSKKYPDFFKETGYGTVTGLKGANCMHDFFPFWEGASTIPPDVVEPEPKTINGKEYTYYECTQQQRKMERDIRALKREVNALEALGESTEEVQAKLKQKMAEYKDFSWKAGMKPKMNRLRVVNVSEKIDVIEAPRIKDKKIRQAHDDFGTVLYHSRGNQKLVTNITLHYDSTPMVLDETISSPFAYLKERDVIAYNPVAPYYENYDMNFVQAHELAHRMDCKEIHSWTNKRFKESLEISRKNLYDNLEEIAKIITKEEYEDDMAFADILSALSKGELNDILFAGHKSEYWEDVSNQCLEIFSNLCCIEINQSRSREVILKYFPELYEAFERMI